MGAPVTIQIPQMRRQMYSRAPYLKILDLDFALRGQNAVYTLVLPSCL